MAGPHSSGAGCSATGRGLTSVPGPSVPSGGLNGEDTSLEICVDGRRIACSSSVLARASNTLRELFSSTPQEGWAAGLAVALRAHPLVDAKLFLELCRDHTDVRQARATLCPGNDFTGVLALADKLDARQVKNACQRALVAQRCGALRVGWMAVARECESPDLWKECAAEVLQLLLTTTASRLDDVGAGCWDSLSAEDYKLLLSGMMRAWQAAQRKQIYHQLDLPTMRAAEKRLRCLPDTAAGAARPAACTGELLSVPVSTALAFRLYRGQLMACLE